MRSLRKLGLLGLGVMILGLTNVVVRDARAEVAFAFEKTIPGTWYTLRVDDEYRFCGAETSFTNGVHLTLIHIRQTGEWMFALAHADWKLAKEAFYTARTSIDGQSFTGDVEAVSENQVALIISEAFLRAFAVGKGLTLHSSSGASIAEISLQGSAKAVSAITTCSTWLAANEQRSPFGSPKVAAPETPFAPKAPPAYVGSGRRFVGPEIGA
jgi:hypothetical protein